MLTIKPVLYVANISEDDITAPYNNEYVPNGAKICGKDNAELVVICAKIEEEMLIWNRM